MSFSLKLLGRWRNFRHKVKALSGISLLSAAVALKSQSSGGNKKDEVMFLSQEENAIPSTADVKLHPSTLGEMRGPILPNGQVNMACSCIEHSVVGPCGPEFRVMRQFIHDMDYSRDNLTEDQQKEFEKVLEAYFMCTMDNPVYYINEMLDEEKEDYKKLEKIKKLQEQKRLEKWMKHFRRYGKDVVMFLPEDENNIPSTAHIEMTEVEEFRAPLFPNGDLNWACTCIEKDVVGPCNIEFRQFRQFIHNTKNIKFEEMTPEEQQTQADEMRQIVRSFLSCCERYPIYYQRYLKTEEDSEIDDSTFEEGEQ